MKIMSAREAKNGFGLMIDDLAAGLAADRFFEIASKSSGQCWSVSTYCPVPGVGPSTPALALRLWWWPSRLSSPLAWLCLWR